MKISDTPVYRRYMALSGTQDAEFENIISLVQASLNTPMAAIAVLDGDQQWFKAKRGSQ